MDSILSSVLSIFSNNPIFVLGIIAYIAFSIIKSKNTEESEEYEDHESSGQTWEDMEREYGIKLGNPAEGKKIFSSVASIADYVSKNRKK